MKNMDWNILSYPEPIEKTPLWGRRIHSKILLLYYLAASSAIFLGFFYYVVGLNTSLWQAIGFLIATPYFFLIVYSADTYVINRHYKPIEKFFNTPTSELTQDVVNNALTRCIDFPLLTFIRVEVVHFPLTLFVIGTALPALNYFVHTDFEVWQYLIGLLIGFIITPLHGFVEYFFVKKIMRAPIQLIENFQSIKDFQLPIRFFKVKRTFMIVLFSILVIPGITIVATLLVKSNNILIDFNVKGYEHQFFMQLILWSLILILSTIIISLSLGFIISNEINDPLTLILARLKKIEHGNYTEELEHSNSYEFEQLFKSTYTMSKSLYEKELIKTKFGKYVPNPAILEQILGDTFRLKGIEKVVTIFFCDIKNFTSLSESLGPQETVELLNSFFTKSVEIVHNNNGIVDKYIGDAFMAIFGALDNENSHAYAAVQTAKDIQKYLEEAKLGYSVGIGINTGPVILGNIGSEERLEYTAVGDTVNIASRIQALTRQYEVAILISSTTFAEIPHKEKVRLLGKARVKGVSNEVELYEVFYK